MKVVSRPVQVLCVVGARPNFTKIAPIIRAFQRPECGIAYRLLHTGQHYDEAMKASFFTQLNIPEPDIDLEVGSASHAVQTAQVMQRFEPVLDKLRPQVVVVVGDVNSTIACALVAAKKGIAVAHVEAGLRSYDRGMPEEINRVLTDQLSDLLYTTERDAEQNLNREGISGDKIVFVGNVMIDTLRYNLKAAIPYQQTLFGVSPNLARTVAERGFGLVTLHRPSNVDHPDVLHKLLATLADISADLPLVFPVHPRTLQKIEAAGFDRLLASGNVLCLPPQGYLEILGLMKDASLVLTDSGGIQEETTALGVPCITLRENTERPITVTQGTNTIVGTDVGLIRQTASDVLQTGGKRGNIPEFWDGHAAERIADHLKTWLHQHRACVA